jgi:hypothetical protein
VIGPQELSGFWMVNAPLVFLFVPLVIEPLRVVLVASAYDAVIGRLAPAAAAAADSADAGELSAR